MNSSVFVSAMYRDVQLPREAASREWPAKLSGDERDAAGDCFGMTTIVMTGIFRHV